MMEPNCDLIRNLCLSLHKCTTSRVQELPIIRQLLDLVLNFVTGDVAEPVYEKLKGLKLQRSRLSVGNVTDLISHDASYLEQLEFASEALYYKRLQDVTPTDERSLSNPRGILQFREEISNIERQKWRCLQPKSPSLNAHGSSCRRDHVIQLLQVLCRGFLDGSWREVLGEIEVLSEQDHLKGSDKADKERISYIGAQLYHTISKVGTYLNHTSRPAESSCNENDLILQQLDQICSRLPTWIKILKIEHIIKAETKSSVQLLMELCTCVNDVAKAMQDSSLIVYVGGDSEVFSWKEGAGPEKCEQGKRLTEMVWRINERLQGYEDCLLQMLIQQDLWDREEWITCLENNMSALCNQRICRHVCDVAMLMQGRNDPHLHNRVLKVFLCSFAAMPSMIQNQICDSIWSHPAVHTLFSTYMKQNKGLHQETTTAFNRLVNIGTNQGLEEAIGRVAVVALQSPSDTLFTAVNRAVSNSAATQSVLKVLQMLPSLTRFKPPEDSKPHLVQILGNVIDHSSDMSSTEEGNLIQLVSQLLQPYQLSSCCPYQEQGLLSHTIFMESSILPHLHCCMMGNGGHDNQLPSSRLELCLKLLNVSLNSSESKQETQPDTTLSTGISTFPIILCLCDLLDQSVALWDSSITPDGKEIVNQILLKVTNDVCQHSSSHQKDNEFNQCLEWLMNKSTGLHWTVQLQLGISLQDALSGYKKVVPACLFDLCDLSLEDWTSIQGSQTEPSSLSDQLVVFLQCCRISEQLASQLFQKIFHKQTLPRADFFQATLVALTTVLPQSSLLEVERIFSILKALVVVDELHVPLSSQFVTCLPTLNFAEYRSSLCMCQLLSSCVTLLASDCCEEWVSLPLWIHTIKGVVSCMKSLTTDITSNTTESPSSKPGSVFALIQLFCHTCHMITLIPSDVTEQLFVLALDLLGRVDEMLPSNQNEDELEWTNQKRAMEIVIENIRDREQRQTLIQKLSGLC